MGPIFHETIFFLRSNPLLFVFSVAGWLLFPLHLAVSLGMYLLRVRVLTSHVGVPSFRFIGHLALEMDGFFKDRALGRHLDFTPVVIYPRDLAANRTMLALWSQKCLVISHPVAARLRRPLVFIPWCRFSIRKYAPGVASVAKTDVYKRYGTRPPILTLPQEIEKQGREYLQRHLPKEHGWYVCLHVRTPGYYFAPTMSLRDSTIENYFEAIEEIVSRGGWVFRMGDPSMPKLPKMKHVVDYAHSIDRSESLDVFLCANCRFFLGSASGLCSVATAFGVPVAIANQCGPPYMRPLSPGDLFIPKFIISKESKKKLSIIEMLDTFVSDLQFSGCLDRNGLTAEENSRSDIRDLVTEMLTPYTEGDTAFQRITAMRRLINASITPEHAAFYGGGDICGRFLLTHEHDLVHGKTGYKKRIESCGAESCHCARRN
jgi:putative glycosyltransferase (TIGR04372 family)